MARENIIGQDLRFHCYEVERQDGRNRRRTLNHLQRAADGHAGVLGMA